jgi:hypothetical protein
MVLRDTGIRPGIIEPSTVLLLLRTTSKDTTKYFVVGYSVAGSELLSIAAGDILYCIDCHIFFHATFRESSCTF